MYDWPEVRPANDRFWASIADHARAAGLRLPERLTRDGDLWAQWEAPDLILSQTCGLPYRARLVGKVRILGSPDYGLEGCPPGFYASKIVVRARDRATAPTEWHGKRLAYNERRSQSGWASILNHAAQLGVGFKSEVASGSHRQSARMVAQGEADITAIDAQSWRLVQAHDPWAGDLQVIGQTEPTPATPFITAGHRDAETVRVLRHALRQAVAEVSAQDRAQLHLRDVVDVDEALYLAVPTPRV